MVPYFGTASCWTSTERKRMEAAQAERETQLRQIFEIPPSGLTMVMRRSGTVAFFE